MRPDEREGVGLGSALIVALFTLSDRQRYIVIQRHIRGRSVISIANELGISRQRVGLTEQRALSHLRVRLRDCQEAFAA